MKSAMLLARSAISLAVVLGAWRAQADAADPSLCSGEEVLEAERVTGKSNLASHCEAKKRRNHGSGRTYGELLYIDAATAHSTGFVLSLVFAPVFAGVAIGTGVASYREKREYESRPHNTGSTGGFFIISIEKWEQLRFWSIVSGALAVCSAGIGVALILYNRHRVALFRRMLKSDPKTWPAYQSGYTIALTPLVAPEGGGVGISAAF